LASQAKFIKIHMFGHQEKKGGNGVEQIQTKLLVLSMLSRLFPQIINNNIVNNIIIITKCLM